MVGQLLLNTNEILQCATVLSSEFGTAEFGQLNMALVKKNPSKSMQHAHCSLYVLEVIFMQ
jgi:hypothetical protein